MVTTLALVSPLGIETLGVVLDPLGLHLGFHLVPIVDPKRICKPLDLRYAQAISVEHRLLKLPSDIAAGSNSPKARFC